MVGQASRVDLRWTVSQGAESKRQAGQGLPEGGGPGEGGGGWAAPSAHPQGS